ncbi:zinc finger protein 62-like [Cylas formicarius]|uniref:zinc finger protein 62-like n=1 Tax=Cylas formicarius TaxID=197179 RepID=UPI0029586FFF|nr:zinc finger protein 62-like [Cylas formicarius]
MAESRQDNFQSCCRLCLSDRQETFKSVFDASLNHKDLPQKIMQFVSIEILDSDRLSIHICDECITRLEAWNTYKNQCLQNQSILIEWLKKSTNVNDISDSHVHIKTEPSDEHEPDIINPDLLLQPKLEPLDISSVDEDYNDLPPPLTPHNPEEHDFLENGEETIQDDGKTCLQCNKSFSSVANRKRHEQHAHKSAFKRSQMCEIRPAVDVSLNNTSSENTKADPTLDESSQDSQSQNSEESTIEPSSQDNQQKIEFAAGLKLFQKDSAPIEFEALSKIELSYLEKCKAMVAMYKTLKCACHKIQHASLRGLLSHLRALRIWFPLFTCYHCMISFTDRSTFTRHHVRCSKKQLETLTKLSNLKKRSEIKTRLYQNFKCVRCKFMYSFHEDYCQHVNEDHGSGDPPFYCSCRNAFDSADDYKRHVYDSCLISYYCDLCFETFTSLDDFQSHAQEMHDNSEGFVLLQDDNYTKRPKHTPAASTRHNNDQSLVVTGKRERRQSSKNPPSMTTADFEENCKDIPTKLLINTIVPQSDKDPKAPAKCPICQKEYSNTYNMVRHYRTHIDKDQVVAANLSDDANSSYYSCPDCGGMFANEEWVQHIQENHEPQTCTECEKTFQFQTELDQHRSVHLNLKISRDSKTHSYKTTMLSPEDEDQLPGGIMLMCEFCDAMFPSKEDLKQHKIMHDMSMDEDDAPMLEVNGEFEDLKDIKLDKFECLECDRQYSSAKSLREHNKHVHGYMKQSEYPKQCDYCEKVCTTGAALFLHKQMHERMMLGDFKKAKAAPVKARKKSTTLEEEEEESYHTCKRCFKVFSSKYNLKAHMKCHGISPPKKGSKRLTCDICKVTFDNDDELIEHKELEHGMNLDEMPDLTNETEEDTKMPIVYTCDVCVITCNSRAALKKHKETHAKEGAKPVVPKTKNTSIYCKYCKIAFNSTMELTRHMHVEHAESAKPKEVPGGEKNIKPFKCPICGKGFATSGAMTAHAGWHKRSKGLAEGPNTPQQTMANKINKQIRVIQKIADAAASKPKNNVVSEFRCSTCLAELPNDTALQIHILEKHRSVNAIMLIPRCNTCSQDFETQEEYDTHKRFHDFLERQKKHDMQKSELPQAGVGSAKPKFPCQYCKSSFSRSDTLNTHIKQHHQEHVVTEFKCNQCDRVFDKQNSLSIHLKVHEKQKAIGGGGSKSQFSCSICNMRFNLPKDLRMHTINAHPF